MVDVFISYSRATQPVVRQLAEAVQRLGYSVWWDDELPPHLSYSDVIADKIGTAKAAIVVWSEGGASSEWVRAEADLARAQKKLIQTSIDGRMPPMPFNQIQFASIGDWRGEDGHPGWVKVKASLEALCGPPNGKGAPPPSRPAFSAPPAAPPPPAGSGSLLVPALLVLLLLAVLIVGFLLWSRGAGEKARPANQAAAPAPAQAPAALAPPKVEAPPPAAQIDGTFTLAATMEGPDAFADVRGGPSADAFVVGRVNRGEVFTTYSQDGSWWRVRTADGTIGYMARSRIRLMSAGAAAPAHEAATRRPVARPAARPSARPAQAAPAQVAAQAPKPGAGAAPQVLHMPFNPRRYCNGPGRGTAECAQLRQRYARPMRGGYR